MAHGSRPAGGVETTIGPEIRPADAGRRQPDHRIRRVDDAWVRTLVNAYVARNGPLITNDIGLLTRAALDGVGLAFMSEEQAAPHLANGALVRVLEDWCPPFPGFFLYYPSRRQHPAALTALIETLRV